MKVTGFRHGKKIWVKLHSGKLLVPKSNKKIIQEREGRFGAQWQPQKQQMRTENGY